MQIVGNEGATIQRRNHSTIKTEARTITKGGIVIGLGHRDTQHCLLDTLLESGQLGQGQAARERYDAGYRLRNIYYRWHVSAKSLSDIGFNAPRSEFESDLPTPQDEAEELFHAVMRTLRPIFRSPVRSICIEGTNSPQKIPGPIASLNGLGEAFYKLYNQA